MLTPEGPSRLRPMLFATRASRGFFGCCQSNFLRVFVESHKTDIHVFLKICQAFICADRMVLKFAVSSFLLFFCGALLQSFKIQSRFCDIDGHGHVNNANLIGYLQDARHAAKAPQRLEDVFSFRIVPERCCYHVSGAFSIKPFSSELLLPIQAGFGHVRFYIEFMHMANLDSTLETSVWFTASPAAVFFHMRDQTLGSVGEKTREILLTRKRPAWPCYAFVP